MKILVVGNGKGSWQIRGEQLGAAIGARVVQAPSDDDLRWADVVVLVKRAGAAWAALVQRFEKPIVWDALDFWTQPRQNQSSEHQARALLHAQLTAIRPALVIGATAAMAQACAPFPAVYVAHHSWDGLRPTLPRRHVETVGYEGNPLYLGQWRRALDEECLRRGWHFVVNPIDLRDADILVAFRDGPWDGWICREWKSGVKVVNAVAAGRPLITQASAGVREINVCHTVVETVADLPAAFDEWTDERQRLKVVEFHTSLAARYRLDVIAGMYRAQLADLVARKQAPYAHQ
jgi:hypothetical protein